MPGSKLLRINLLTPRIALVMVLCYREAASTRCGSVAPVESTISVELVRIMRGVIQAIPNSSSLRCCTVLETMSAAIVHRVQAVTMKDDLRIHFQC